MENLRESDVWDVIAEREKKAANEPDRSNHTGLLSRQLRTAARAIPRASVPPVEPNPVQHSAPVDIPNWSDADQDCCDDDEDGDCRLPPHEWLAKKARGRASSFSVCEGAGRTLKGRDLSRVRHAVLTKTGFI